MGISLVRDKYKSGEIDDKAIVVTPQQCVNSEKFFEDYNDGLVDTLKKLFPSLNILMNHKLEGDFQKNAFVQQQDDENITGFTTSEFMLSQLENGQHEKFYRVFMSEETKKYSYLQSHKFIVLYAFYKAQQGKLAETQDDFFKMAADQLSIFHDDRSATKQNVALSVGLRFSMAMLRDISAVQPAAVEEPLRQLYESLCDAPTGSLHSNDFNAFEQDVALDDARDFLTALIKQNRSAVLNELCVKILVRMGLVRSNPEDFLVVVNLLNQNPALASCDLRNEIHSMEVRKLKVAAGEKDTFDKKLADFKQGAELCNLAPSFMKEAKEDLTGRWTTDGDFFYAPGPGLHKYNIPRDSSENMFVIDQNTDVSYDNSASLCHLNGKLYVLKASADEPLLVFNPSTLLKDECASSAIKWQQEPANAPTMKTTEEADKETSRKMTQSPLFTDGEHLYTCSLKIVKRPAEAGKDEELDENKVEKAIVVLEKYCTQSWRCLKQTPLYKNKFLDLFSKASVDEATTFLKSACFAMAGGYMYVTHAGVEYIYSVGGENGFVVYRSSEAQRHTHVIHDLRGKKLYSFNTSNPKNQFLYDFSAPIFKQQAASSDLQLLSPAEQLRSRYLAGFNHQVRPNMVERKFKQVKVENSAAQPALQVNASLVKAILLNFVSSNCESFNERFNQLASNSLSQLSFDEKLEMSHFSGATYSTAVMFENLCAVLKSLTPLINAEKSEKNLEDQIALRDTIKILQANFKALAASGIKPTQILRAQLQNELIQVFQNSITQIQEKKFRAPESEPTCQRIWLAITRACQEIMADSIQIVYSDSQSVLKVLIRTLSAPDCTDVQREDCAFLLHYLVTNVKQIFAERAIHDLKQVCTLLSEYQKQQKLRQIKSMPLFEEQTAAEPESMLDTMAARFMRVLSEQLFVQLENTIVDLGKKAERSDEGIKKRKEDTEYLELLKDFTPTVYAKICDLFSGAFDFIANEVTTAVSEQDKDYFSSVTAGHFKNYCRRVHVIVTNPQHIYVLNLFNTVMAQLGVEETEIAGRVVQAAQTLISSLSNFIHCLKTHVQKVVKGKTGAEEPSEPTSDAEIQNMLTDQVLLLIRRVAWMVGFIANNLIGIRTKNPLQDEDKETEAQKMIRLFLNSKVLSGGIENRFLPQFSAETKDQLRQIINITRNDQETLNHLNKAEPVLSPDDKLLSEILEKGRNSEVDFLIKVMQFQLEKPISRCQYARIQGEDGMRLSRAVFAVMIKYAQYTDKFEECLTELDMAQTELEMGLAEQEQIACLASTLSQNSEFQMVLHEWAQASKVRVWITEKKKNKSEKLGKSERTNYLAEKKKAAEASESSKPAAQTEESKDAPAAPTNDESQSEAKDTPLTTQIDTSTTEKKDEGGAGKESENKGADSVTKLSEADKKKIEERVEAKMNLQMEEIFNKIVEKALCLLQMSVPQAYKFSPQSQAKLVSMPSIDRQEMDDQEKQQDKEDWTEKLKRWKTLKQTEGAVKSSAKQRQEIFDSGNTSVLACLLTPITAQKITKEVESECLKAAKRVAGLTILSSLVQLPLSWDVKTDLTFWFTASLRDGKNNLTHYMNNIKLCSHHFEEQLRSRFFDFLTEVCRCIKQSRDKTQIIRFLDALVWKYMGRDHASLVKLDIFQLLSRGDGDLKHPIRLAWGRQLLSDYTWKDEEEPDSLPFMLINTFERCFFNVISRVVQDDLGKEIQLKARGTTIPRIEKSKSVLAVSISEQLIAKAFQVVFEELRRYDVVSGHFGGFDWASFVRKFKMLKKENLQEKVKLGADFTDENLFDIDELVKAAEKEKEERQKQKEKEEETKADQDACEAKALSEEGDKPTEGEQAAELTDDKKLESTEAKDDDKASAEGAGNSADEKPEGKDQDSEKEASDNEGTSSEKDESEETPQQKLQREAAEKVNELVNQKCDDQMKAIHKLYNDSFLRRVIRILEVFTSIACTQQNALALMHKIANPDWLVTLFKIYERTRPGNQITVLKVLQNLIRIGIPESIFEMIAERQGIQSTNSQLKLESGFLNYWLQKLYRIRSAAFDKYSVQSHGSYEVSQEIANLLLAILSSRQSCYEGWCRQISAVLKEACLRIETLSASDRDVVFALIRSDFIRMCNGRHGLNENGQYVTALGYREAATKENESRDEDSSESKNKTYLEPLQSTFSNERQELHCLYIDPKAKSQQEIIKVAPHTVSPVQSIDCDAEQYLAEETLMGDGSVIAHLLHLLTDSKSDAQLQVYLLNFFMHVKQFKPFTTTIEKSCTELLHYLFGVIFSQKESNQANSVPRAWLETQLANLKAFAIENSVQLQKSIDCSCKVLNKRQLLFTYIDEQSGGNKIVQSVQLLSTFNLRKVTDTSQYAVVDAVQKSVLRNQIMFVAPETLVNLDAQTFEVLASCEAIVTHSTDLNKLVQDIVAKIKAREEMSPEEKSKELEWAEALQCIIFLVEKRRFEEVKNRKHGFRGMDLARHDAPKDLNTLRRDLKEWGQIDLDTILYHLCSQEKNTLNYDDVLALVPQLLQIVDEEKKKQAEQLESASADQLTRVRERFEKENEERAKKVADTLAAGTKFDFSGDKQATIASLVRQEKAKGSDEFYDIMKTEKKDLELEKLLTESFWNKEKENDDDENNDNNENENDQAASNQSQQKTEAQLVKMFLASTTIKANIVVERDYARALEMMLAERSSTLLVHILENLQMSSLLPVILESAETQRKVSLFLKQQFNSAYMVKVFTGQKAQLKQTQAVFRTLFRNCINTEGFDSFAADFMRDFVVIPGIETLKQLHGKKSQKYNTFFKEPSAALEFLHPALLCFFGNLALELKMPILKNKNCLPQLFQIALGMMLKFWVNGCKIPTKLFNLCENIVYYATEHIGQYVEDDAMPRSLINNDLLIHITSKIKKPRDAPFKDAQRICLHLQLQLLNLQNALQTASGRKVSSKIVLSPEISEAKTLYKVMQSGADFNELKYQVFTRNLKPQQLEQHFERSFQTLHPHYEVTTRAKFYQKQVEHLTIKPSTRNDCKPLTYIGLSLSADGSNMNYLTRKRYMFDIPLQNYYGSFYMFYPIKRQIIVGMGDKKGGRMGKQQLTDMDVPDDCTLNLWPVKVAASRYHSMFLTKSGELWGSGCKDTDQQVDTYEVISLPKQADKTQEIVDRIFCGRSSKWFIAKSGKTYFRGISREFNLPYDKSISTFTEFKLPVNANAEPETVVDIACGNKYNLFVSDKGKLWAMGRTFLKRAGINDFESAQHVPFPENNWKVVKAWASNVKEQEVAIVMVKDEAGKTQLWSLGSSLSGLLGQGSSTKDSQKFAKLDYDSNNVTFVDVSVSDNHALAIDQHGQLWSWGSNHKCKAGLIEEILQSNQPTKATAFNEMGIKAIRVSAGKNHSLVLAEEANGNQRLYSIGQDESLIKPLGCTKERVTDSIVRKIAIMADLDILDFCASADYNLVLLKGDDSHLNNLQDHLIDNQVHKGVMHAFKQDGRWQFMPQSEYEANRGAGLPDVSIAFKYPIKDMDKVFNGDKPLITADLDSLLEKEQSISESSTLTEKEIQSVVYKSLLHQTDGQALHVSLSEHEFLSDSNCYDMHPLVYYRLKRPLKAGSELPSIDLRQCYTQSSKYGYQFQVQPNFSPVYNAKLVETLSNEWHELTETMEKFPMKNQAALLKQMDSQLPDKVEFDVVKQLKNFKVKDMTFTEGKVSKLPLNVKEKNVQFLWMYNCFFDKLFQYVPNHSSKGFKGQTIPLLKFDSSKLSSLLLLKVKQQIVSNQIGRLNNESTQNRETNVTLNRNAALRFEEAGNIDHQGTRSIFGQVYSQVKNNPTIWRVNSSDAQVIRFNFEGEYAIDAGGPYRESLTNMIGDLERGVVPLLVKTANNVSNSGEMRNCFMLNHDSCTPTHMQMFEFLGVLIGFAFRSASCLPFNFPPLFWKQLLDLGANERDIKSVDNLTYTIFENLRKQAKQIQDNDMFRDIMDMKFTEEVNSNTIELCPDGKDKHVDRTNFEEYISLVVDRRLNLASKQMKAVRKGVEIIVPLDIMKVLTINEIDDRVCGLKVLDIEKLKKMTNYSCCEETDKIVQWFWAVMEKLEPEDQQLYLKFVWGRSRMPAVLGDYEKHTIYFNEYAEETQLPDSHTCFFQIDLPKYTSQEQLESKLLTAIRFCGDIDTG